MKLRLRIGRQRAQAFDADQPRTGDAAADRAPGPRPAPAAVPVWMPPQRTPDERVVRAGSFCRASEVGQTAVTEAGHAVLAVRAGRCGRWVYRDADEMVRA